MRRGLYSVAQVREMEARAIAGGVPGYTLMQRAGSRCWQEILRRWPAALRIHIFCGSGNNGGDGYVIARLAQQAARQVAVWQVGSAPDVGQRMEQLPRLTAYQDWLKAGGTVKVFSAGALADAELVVDALFGTGLAREISGEALAAVQAMNASGVPVLAVDLPSGLDADTGRVWGEAVRATLTVSFMAPKLGLYTGAAVDCAGELVVDDLGLALARNGLPHPALRATFSRGEKGNISASPIAYLLHESQRTIWLPRRARTAHKGTHGHVLVTGGDAGMMGAALLAGRAALRAGAGLVSVATRAVHAVAMTAAQPELMCHGVEQARDFSALLERAEVIAIGPGLGQGEWGRALLAAALECKKPLVVDADALNLLAQEPVQRRDWVLTPHPGEAARMLGLSTAQVQTDRLAAVRALCEKFGGVVVLKGAGTLVQGEESALCPYGNPGMGAGGMGDVLAGIIAAFIAQGLALEAAAQAGVLVHALAGDRAARQGERGLLPSDLIAALPGVVNP